jgi:hypothetical protein
MPARPTTAVVVVPNQSHVIGVALSSTSCRSAQAQVCLVCAPPSRYGKVADVAEAPNDNNQDAVLIRGFGFSGYRSFLGEPQIFGPLSKVNVIAGRNNAGKSNVLGFAQRFLRSPHFNLEELDYPDRNRTGVARLLITAGEADSLIERLITEGAIAAALDALIGEARTKISA